MPYTLYVIELDREVFNIRRFREENPDHRPDKPCVYVGMTGRTAEQRFEQHKSGYKANRYAKKYSICATFLQKTAGLCSTPFTTFRQMFQ